MKRVQIQAGAPRAQNQYNSLRIPIGKAPDSSWSAKSAESVECAEGAEGAESAESVMSAENVD